MILGSRETCIAYRCPYCASGIKSMVGVFALSGAMKKLKCTCEASELTINHTNDGKLRITVPCLLCGGEHTFIISSNLFFKKELFVYQCPQTAMDLVFIGTEPAVSEALDKSEKELTKLLSEMGIDDLGILHGEIDDFDDDDASPCDPMIYDTVMFVIEDLIEGGDVSCCCDEGDYDVAVSDDHVKVFCRSCGASKDIPTDSELAARAFVETAHLKLEKL